MLKNQDSFCDATLFHNEFEILEFRLGHLTKIVDHFYVAESQKTFSGKERELVLKNYVRKLPSEIRNKVHVIEIPTSELNLSDPWSIEASSRNYLLSYVFEAAERSKMIFSDLDEIPSIDQLIRTRFKNPNHKILNIPMKVSYRKANWELNNTKELWRYPKLVFLEKFKTPKELLNVREMIVDDLEGEPGLHLSYVGMNAGGIKEKFNAFSHTEFNRPKFYDSDLIALCDKYRISHLGDAHKSGMGLLREVLPQSFGSVQASISISNPNWISSGKNVPSKLMRIYKSLLITYYLESNELKQLKDSFKFFQNLLWVIKFCHSKLLQWFRRLM